nr:hypothetical protein Iba_chr06aCG14730 [Ipomoea batatas]
MVPQQRLASQPLVSMAPRPTTGREGEVFSSSSPSSPYNNVEKVRSPHAACWTAELTTGSCFAAEGGKRDGDTVASSLEESAHRRPLRIHRRGREWSLKATLARCF